MEITVAWLLLRGVADDSNSLLSLNVDYFPLLKEQCLEEDFFKKNLFISILLIYFINLFVFLI